MLTNQMCHLKGYRMIIYLFCRAFFVVFVAHRPGLDPRTFHTPSPSKPRQSATPARSKRIRLITSSKLNKHAPTDRLACWILLALVPFNTMYPNVLRICFFLIC